jgi:hypothetical protein
MRTKTEEELLIEELEKEIDAELATMTFEEKLALLKEFYELERSNLEKGI